MTDPNRFMVEVMVSEHHHFKSLPVTHAANQGCHPLFRIEGVYDPKSDKTTLTGGYQGGVERTRTANGRVTPDDAVRQWYVNQWEE